MSTSNGSSHRALVWLILVLAPLAVFWQVRGFDFVNFDDVDYVYGNARVQAGLGWDNLRWAFSTTHASNWHPLVWLSLMLDAQLWGVGAGGFHLINLLLHITNGLLVFVVLNRMTGSWWRSAVVAALFAVHPLHVESVAWISARKDLLSTLFGLLALWSYAEYARRPRASWYGLALVAYVCSLMSKQMLVTLPFLLLLLDYWPLSRCRPGAWRRLLVEKLPFFALAAVFSVVVLLAQYHGGAVADLERSPFGPRFANAIVACVLYLWRTVWPQGLACFYPYSATGVSALAAAGSAFLLALITVASLTQARRRPYLPVGWLWFAGSLVPVIGLVQIGSQSMADRYTYWPLTGLFVAVVWFVPSPSPRARRQHALLALATASLIVALAVVARIQAGTWRDTATVWRHAIAVTRDNYRAHNNLGASLGAVGRHDEAAHHFGQALEVRPDYASAHGNLGKVLDLQGRFDEAVDHFRRAVEIDPGLASAHVNWAIALSSRGRLEEAILQFRAAIEADPGNSAALQLLAEALQAYGVGLLRQGRRDEAAAQFREALRIAPDLIPSRKYLSSLQD